MQTTWMLSQCYTVPESGFIWPYCAAYSNGVVCPKFPPENPTSGGWALVRCRSSAQQIEAAAQDPRIQPYRTLWDTLTPDTVTAYAAAGAKDGMMLCQLLALLAQTEAGYGDVS